MSAPGPGIDRDSLKSLLRVDGDSPLPYYVQLAHQFEDLLAGGHLAQGEQVPTERELAQALGVSRMVVKRCYEALREQGWLQARGRAGTVVGSVPSVSPRMGRLKGFSQEMREQGRIPSTQLLQCGPVTDRTMASMFRRPSTSPLLHVVRIRLADNVPMSLERAWYDLVAAPALEQWNGLGSGYDFLRDICGIPLAWADQTIEAAMTGPEEMQAFGQAKPSPCLLLKRHSYSNVGGRQLIEYAQGMFRGDAYVYQVRLRG